jgi:hypothetical protein
MHELVAYFTNLDLMGWILHVNLLVTLVLVGIYIRGRFANKRIKGTIVAKNIWPDNTSHGFRYCYLLTVKTSNDEMVTFPITAECYADVSVGDHYDEAESQESSAQA